MQKPDFEVKNFHGILSSSAEMFDLFQKLARVAKTDAAILIRGETGSGKELVARAIHAISHRSQNNYFALNCATLTPELMGSELFGHVKGAFTGASHDRKGLFEEANHGTLFLDEIAEIPLALQSRLLRVVQEKTFNPLGTSRSKTVDVRFLSATHKALRHEVEEGRFREDLMYRIRVVPLFIPPLRERNYDIEILTWIFIEQFNHRGWRHIEGIQEDAYDALKSYSWPGNVRELHNNIEYAIAIGEGPNIRLEDLTPELRGEKPNDGMRSDLKLLEREEILKALRQSKGRKSEAAHLLGISRSTLWRKAKEMGIF